MNEATPVNFSILSQWLHWSMAAMVLAMLFVGIGMAASVSERYRYLLAFHRPLGLAFLVLVVVRIANRFLNPSPALLARASGGGQCAGPNRVALPTAEQHVHWRAQVGATHHQSALTHRSHRPRTLESKVARNSLLRGITPGSRSATTGIVQCTLPSFRNSVQPWNTTAAVRYPRLERNLAVEVAIVGAGITGLTLALQLVRAGRSGAVLDQQTVGAGATGDSTGHLTACLDISYGQLSRKFGAAGARVAAQSSMAAIAFIEDTVTELAIACDFMRVPGYHFCQNLAAAQQLAHEADLTRSLGLATSFEFEAPLPMPICGALRFADQAQFDAPRYCQGLAHALPGAVYGDTRVESLTEGEPCRVRTTDKIVTAQTIAMATHVPILRASALQEDLTVNVSYTLAFELRGGGFPDGLFWDAEDPSNYIRRDRTISAGHTVCVQISSHG